MLTKVDDLNLPDHWYLDTSDECYFIGEYTAGRGFAHSATNQLILNLKKSVDRRGLAEWRHKESAIRQAASSLRNSLNPEFLTSATFVPVPPSRVTTDPLYDDRMTQVIQLLDENVDARPLVIQLANMHDAHSAATRPGPSNLYENYGVDPDLVEPSPSQVAVVDDVLTTGAHFKAMKRILRDTYPDVRVVGLFLARRVPNTD